LTAEHIEKHSHMLELFGSGIVTSILLIILVRKVRPSFISPVYGLVFVYLGVFILGGLFYDPDYGMPGMYMSEEETIRVMSQIFWVVSAFMTGAVLFATISKRRAQLRRPINIGAVRVSQLQTACGIVISIASIGMAVIGTGVGNLWYRREYIVQVNQIAQISGNALFLPSTFALGVIAGQHASRARLLALAIFGVIEALTVALSTRNFALLPIVFCIGCLLAQPKNAKFRAALAITSLLTPFAMMVPLATRGMAEQGFSTFPQIFQAMSRTNLVDQLQEVLNNVLVSVPLTIQSAMPFAENARDYLLLNLDPTPGVWSGWYAKELRYNVYMPFNAIGDLLRVGTWVAILYYAIVGVFFARIDARLKSASRIGPELLLLIALAFGFIVFSLQYSLRAATRLVYYAIAIELIWRMASMVAPRVRSRLATVWLKEATLSSTEIS